MKRFFQVLIYLPFTFFFNFWFLPLKQAVKIPIVLYKPKFNLKGKYIIDSEKISFGMIRLGFNVQHYYPNSGIKISNNGTVIFKGKVYIGNASFINVGKFGKLTFGNNFNATASLCLICHNRISFEQNVLVGWETIFIDTDFHILKNKLTNEKTQGYAPIHIGNNNWFGMKCSILKGTKTPPWCTVASGTMLTAGKKFESYSIIGGNPIKVLKTNIYRDPTDDKPNYSQFNDEQITELSDDKI